jgi:dTDP-4-amino-4,6-dideoxygalactose transaminase
LQFEHQDFGYQVASRVVISMNRPPALIVTDDDQVAQRCRSWRNQGRSDAEGWLENDDIGYNYRLSDINCALGSSQLSRLNNVISARQRVAALYDAALKSIPEITPPLLEEPGCDISWFVYVVRLNDEFNRADRDQIIAELRQHGIGCRNYFPPIHLQPLYARRFAYRPGAFPVTEHVSDRTIALPFFNRLSEGEVHFICTELKRAIQSLGTERTVAGWQSRQTVSEAL